MDVTHSVGGHGMGVGSFYVRDEATARQELKAAVQRLKQEIVSEWSKVTA